MTEMAQGDRDSSKKFSWAEMSSLLTYLRQEVEEVRAGTGRGFDEALAKIRKPLERLAAYGGDPRFALVALVSARWRSVRSPGAEIERGRRLLERLAAEAELLKLLEGTVAPHFKSSVAESLKFLKSFAWQDRGVFDSRGTLRQPADRRRESSHVTRVAAVLDWHLRIGTTGRWHRRALVAQLLDDVGLLRYRRGGDPVEQVNRRLGRIKNNYYQKFAVPEARLTFHDIHRSLAITLDDASLRRCGTACPEFDSPDDPLSRGKLFIEPAELGITAGQGVGENPVREAGGDPPTFEFRAAILDREPPEIGPAQPRATDDQAGCSDGSNPSRSKRTRRRTT